MGMTAIETLTMESEEKVMAIGMEVDKVNGGHYEAAILTAIEAEDTL